jgi:RNA polymerase sigma-70 factor, ECF subfamily
MDLLAAARRGREVAFLEVFDRHHAALFRFAYRFTGSSADAEDIVQECFLELLRPACAYDPARTSIRTYLFGIVRNQSLKRLRSGFSRQSDPAATGAVPDRSPDSPENDLLRGELSDAVARAVMQLPETQRDVLILAHYEQMPLAEIAQLTDLDMGAVKSRLQRARATLRETLAAWQPSVPQPDLERKK